MVFIAHDVGQERELVLFLDQADGDAGHRVADRHAGVHERQGAAADAGHAAGAVGFEDVADDADGVGELLRAGDHGLEAALGQGPVADLAPAGPADRTALADAEGREIVIEHELLAVFVDQAVDALLVAAGAEGGGDEGLGFAAGEEGRAMGARQNAHFAS